MAILLLLLIGLKFGFDELLKTQSISASEGRGFDLNISNRLKVIDTRSIVISGPLIKNTLWTQVVILPACNEQDVFKYLEWNGY